MLKHYFANAIASLSRSKRFSMILIAGLSVALAACMLILLYVQNESSYDTHWPDGDRIFRINQTFNLPGRDPWRLSQGSALLLPAMREYFAEEIETAARARPMEVEYRTADKVFNETVVAVDPGFFDVFALTGVAGNLAATSANRSGIALSEALAERLFGSTDVLGNTLSLLMLGQTIDYTITAVYQMPAGNTVLELPAIIHFDDSRAGDFEITSWTLAPVATWLKLKPGVDVRAVSGQLDAFTDQYVDISNARLWPDARPSDHLYYDLKNVSALYLDSNYENLDTVGNKTTVQAFSVIAVLILLVASINFAILTLARGAVRAKDVAVRKVAGATSRQLIAQYLIESCLLSLIAMVAGLMLVEIISPAYEVFFGIELHIDYRAPQTWLAFFALLVVAGTTGGLYPALIITRSPVADIANARAGTRRRELSGREVLVVFQFAVSIALVIATGIIYLQVQFISNRDPGFNGSNLLVIEDLRANADGEAQLQRVLRQAIAGLPDVRNASLSSYRPAATTALARMSAAYTMEGRAGESAIFATAFIDDHFFQTWETALIAGRDFSEVRDQTDLSFLPGLKAEDIALRTVVINEAAVRSLGLSNPQDALGKVLAYPSEFPGINYTYTVIGVARNTQFYSLRSPPRPELYFYHPYFTDALTVRYQDSPDAMLQAITTVWQSVMGDAELSISLLQQHLDREFAQERKEGSMFISFSLLSIFIACLGLYGCAAFTIERRTREIAIRKVMGAELRQIVSLLLWQFSKPVLLANIIAWPLALWAMLSWLQRFPYRIDTLILIPLCVLAGAIALSIAWLTVAGNTLRVASTHPVRALRYE